MAEVEDSVYRRLLELCGPIVGERVRPGGVALGTDEPPYVTLRVTKYPETHATGTTTTEHADIEVLGIAATYPGKQELAAAIRQLNGWSDKAGSPAISGCLQEREDESFEVAAGQEEGSWVAGFMFSAWYERK